MKTGIVLVALLACAVAPSQANALYGYILFTVNPDPDDQGAHGASTGWSRFQLRDKGLDPDRPLYFTQDEDFPMSFLWDGDSWSEQDAFLASTSGNNYYSFDGILRGWAMQSGTYLDWLDSDLAPDAFLLAGKGSGSGDCSITYHNRRGVWRGHGTWRQSDRPPDIVPPVEALAYGPEPVSSALAGLGLMGLMACRRQRLGGK